MQFVSGNPLAAVGYLHDIEDQFLGSCFLVENPGLALTAAHVVLSQEGHLLQGLTSHFPASWGCRQVESIVAHQDADLAVLKLAQPDNEPDNEDQRFVFALPETDILSGDDGTIVVGIDVGSYGFRFEHPVRDAASATQVPRWMTGAVQRQITPCDNPDCSYHPATTHLLEVDYLIPEGMSGGPVFEKLRCGSLLGVNVGNQQTERVVERVTTRDENGMRVYDEVTSMFVTYGLVQRISEYVPWIRQVADSASPEGCSDL